MVPHLATSTTRGPGAAVRRTGLRFTTRVVHAPLLAVIVKRLLLAVPLLLAVSMLSFLLESLTPGDAARSILGVHATPDAYASLRRTLGLDLPLLHQYWNWLSNAVQGDMGVSLFNGQDVMHQITSRLPVTLSLIAGALLLSVVVGVALGTFSAVRGGVGGRLADAVSILGFAMPTFWVGAIFIVVFAVDLGWFPATGYVPWADSPGRWFQSLVLPVVALALAGIAAVARQTREAMLEALASEYVRMARANGIAERSIVFRHALRNAGMRVVTILGVQAVVLLGGTVFVENVFALPGLGSLIVTASIQHDLPTVQAIVVFFTVIVVLVNLLIDLLYVWLNPRLRVR